jgi:hypothetical protein
MGFRIREILIYESPSTMTDRLYHPRIFTFTPAYQIAQTSGSSWWLPLEEHSALVCGSAFV